MKHYRYLIIGGGLTGDAAVRGIRELDTESSIGMISRELDPPYTRPKLSKDLWKGRPVEKIWRNTRDLGVELYLKHKIVQLDPQSKSIHDDKGEKYTYDKLLLATGGSPNRLPFGADNIIYYRSFQDYQRLRAMSEHKKSFLVIGGGFIGSEIAAALTMVGNKVTMIFPENAIGARVYPADLSHFINNYYRQQGVVIIPEDTAVSVEQAGERLLVRTGTGRVIEVDGIVAGIGIHPNIELAQQAGLKVENGIIVDEHLQTSVPDIYAAGDVANFYYPALDKRMRVEHEDNAITMGKYAGRNMAGANEPYTHAPMFYSDLFELGFEAVGELNSKLDIIADWQEPYKKGIVYYLENGRVRGVLLWNVWNTVPAARTLLTEPGPFKSTDLIGRLDRERN
ncbi:MAG: NAD(P)/FAD-dependent oxidoreductase [Anaerolineaceae bacterium]|nr:NAD(P)/FAD-dependent oxidoreductase [Anaerolineaceae bacterium]